MQYLYELHRKDQTLPIVCGSTLSHNRKRSLIRNLKPRTSKRTEKIMEYKKVTTVPIITSILGTVPKREKIHIQAKIEMKWENRKCKSG